MVAKKTASSTKPELGQDIEPGFLAARAAVTGGISGTPADEEMTLINKLSRSGNVDPATIYRFDCVPSTQAIDSYFTRMDVSSLINYAEEAKAGIPVLNSHRSGSRGQAELPIGRSFTGTVENDPENAQMQRFVASAYMLRNNRANGSVNTDDIIAGIEAGTVSDISIGFAFGAGTAEKNYSDRTILKCSICGNDFLRSDPWGDGENNCNHWPGEMYKLDGGKKSELCVLDVVNAHLSEFSTVYNGATPGAVILKAQRAASDGLLDRVMIHRLEDTYRTRLMDYTNFQIPVIGASSRKEKTEGQEITPDVAEKENPVSSERTNDEMANTKRELEDASKEGAKLALANLAKSVMGSREFNDVELALFPEIETRLAAGELDQANLLLTRLMTGPVEGGEGEFYEDTGRGVEGNDPEGEPPTVTSIVSMSLIASERQQFQALKEENTRLKKEARRLAPLAEIGERAWSELIDLTIGSYGRAGLGDGEEIREMLTHLPFDNIRTLRFQYETIAQQLFTNPDGSTGRQTVPADPNQPNFGQALNVAAPEPVRLLKGMISGLTGKRVSRNLSYLFI